MCCEFACMLAKKIQRILPNQMSVWSWNGVGSNHSESCFASSGLGNWYGSFLPSYLPHELPVPYDCSKSSIQTHDLIYAYGSRIWLSRTVDMARGFNCLIYKCILQLDSHYPTCPPWDDLRAHRLHIWSRNVWDGEGERWDSLWSWNLCWGWIKTAIWTRTRAGFPPRQVLCRHCQEAQGSCLRKFTLSILFRFLFKNFGEDAYQLFCHMWYLGNIV